MVISPRPSSSRISSLSSIRPSLLPYASTSSALRLRRRSRPASLADCSRPTSSADGRVSVHVVTLQDQTQGFASHARTFGRGESVDGLPYLTTREYWLY